MKIDPSPSIFMVRGEPNSFMEEILENNRTARRESERNQLLAISASCGGFILRGLLSHMGASGKIAALVSANRFGTSHSLSISIKQQTIS
jgi:hypothetical protein